MLQPGCRKLVMKHGLRGNWTRRRDCITKTQAIELDIYHMQNGVLLSGLLLKDQPRMGFGDLNQTLGLGNRHGKMEIAVTVGVISKHRLGMVMQMVKWKEIGKLSSAI